MRTSHHPQRSVLRHRPIRVHRWLCAGAVVPLVAAAATVVFTASTAEAHTVINPADWQQIELARGVNEVGEPMSLAVLPDRSVLHTARSGTLRRTDVNGTTSVVANIPVYTHDEEGLQGIAVDPNFASKPLCLPVLRAAVVHPGRRRAGHRHGRAVRPVRRRQPAVPVHAQLDLATRRRGHHPRRADQPRHVLPRRR